MDEGIQLVLKLLKNIIDNYDKYDKAKTTIFPNKH